ncbi:MAG: hypothetical protein ACI88H_000196 [Cocleimonas sp.]|jgi:hypothetical protein
MSTAKTLRTDPDLPPELKDAALHGKLVLFVGAGASMLVGMPSWWQLATKALQELVEIDAINYAELEQLKKLPDPKKQLSIADIIAKQNGHVFNHGKHLVSKGGSTIYDSINSIKATCVTTNYDHELKPKSLEETPDDQTKPHVKRLSGADNLNAADLKELGTVFHLHGDMSNPETMVVTTSDYLTHYDHEKVQHFLGELFANHVVLFIGYGLEEVEILEHILRHSEVREEAEVRRRFLLQPFFQSEQRLYEYLMEYYKKSFGVHLIGYPRDFKDYKQLEKIMADWARDLEVRPTASVDEIADIDRIINNE